MLWPAFHKTYRLFPRSVINPKFLSDNDWHTHYCYSIHNKRCNASISNSTRIWWSHFEFVSCVCCFHHSKVTKYIFKLKVFEIVKNLCAATIQNVHATIPKVHAISQRSYIQKNQDFGFVDFRVVVEYRICYYGVGTHISTLFRTLTSFLQNISPSGATATRIRPYLTILQCGWGTSGCQTEFEFGIFKQ